MSPPIERWTEAPVDLTRQRFGLIDILAELLGRRPVAPPAHRPGSPVEYQPRRRVRMVETTTTTTTHTRSFELDESGWFQ